MRRHWNVLPSITPALLLVAVLALTGCESQRRLNAPEIPGTGLAGRPEATPLDRIDALVEEQDELETEPPGRAIAIDGPTVITRPGAYRVTRDFSAAATGDGIVIRSDDVALWLGDHTLTGPGNKAGRGIAVEDARHVSVHGGQLQTFGIGIVLAGSQGVVVRGVRVTGGDEFADPANGVPPQIGVMLVNSPHNRIARNRLHAVNLGIFVRGGGSHDNLIRKNEVLGAQHGLLAICYNPAPTGGSAGPYDDLVVQNELVRFGAGIQTSAGSASNRFVRNSIGYFSEPWHDFNGTNLFVSNRTEQLTP